MTPRFLRRGADSRDIQSPAVVQDVEAASSAPLTRVESDPLAITPIGVQSFGGLHKRLSPQGAALPVGQGQKPIEGTITDIATVDNTNVTHPTYIPTDGYRPGQAHTPDVLSSDGQVLTRAALLFAGNELIRRSGLPRDLLPGDRDDGYHIRENGTGGTETLVVSSLNELPGSIRILGKTAHDFRPDITQRHAANKGNLRRRVAATTLIGAVAAAGVSFWVINHNKSGTTIGAGQLLIPGGKAIDPNTKKIEPIQNQPVIEFRTTVDGRVLIDMTPKTKTAGQGITGKEGDDAFNTRAVFSSTIRITAPNDEKTPSNSAVIIDLKSKTATVNLDKITVNILPDPLKFKEEMIPAGIFNEQLSFTKEAVNDFLAADAISKDFAGPAPTEKSTLEMFKKALANFYRQYEGGLSTKITNIVVARGLQSAIANKGPAQDMFMAAIKAGIAQAYWNNDRNLVLNANYKGWSPDTLKKVADGIFADITKSFPVDTGAVDLVTIINGKNVPPLVTLEPITPENGGT